MVSRASSLLAGVVVLAGCAIGQHASAQSNPFVPASQAQRADIERIVDERMKSSEARLMAAIAKAGTAKGAAATVPGAPGLPGSTAASGVPGSPIGGAGPMTPGGAGPSYPPVGSMGGSIGGGMPGMQAPQVSDIQQQRQSGTRFLGCINGTHKFMKTTGERVTFSPAQINRAVKDGELPACR